MEVSTVTRPRFRIRCDDCDLSEDVEGPAIVYAYQDARALEHDHSSALYVEYATRGGFARVGGPRSAPIELDDPLSGGRGPRDELSEALLALDDDPPIEITE